MPMLQYLLVALVAWTHQTPEAMQPWAAAMADVCTTKEECTLLAAQAFVETRFVDWVVDGSCNDPTWRKSRRGWERAACDGGHAYGAWQIHDSRLLGASAGFQASVALGMMRAHPELWTTRAAARSQAAWWLASH
jgi:hypothetical protein